MVQYDPFATMIESALPDRTKEEAEQTRPSRSPGSPASITAADTVNIFDGPAWFNHARSNGEPPRSHKNETPLSPAHPQLRTLSTSQISHPLYCSKCHMRRPSREHLFRPSHDHSPIEESWDGFCPDIAMPEQPPRRSSSRHHVRRHSGLCPENVIAHEHLETTPSPTQITTLKHRGCHQSGSWHHQECRCENIIPTENLAERYGLVEEDESECRRKRQSLEHAAAEQVAEIMHEELIADMERGSRGFEVWVPSWGSRVHGGPG